MKTIGLIGGMSWHSTETYYRRINEQVAARLGGHASAGRGLDPGGPARHAVGVEEPFYAERLSEHQIDVVVPEAAGRGPVDRVVFDELTQGRFLRDSRAAYVEIMRDLARRGAQAVVLVSSDQAPLPVIDTATAHADFLVDLALDR